jgi:sugar phosphate isomerase/epimerase
MSKQDISGRLYLSTVAEDAVPAAEQYGLGLEIAEFCTAMNMDENFTEYDGVVRRKLRNTARRILHAPFNELCPAAIDPKVYEIAKKRYQQAYELAGTYGIKRLVVHSGFVPLVYFPSYFAERSVVFWKEFLSDKPDDLTLVLENVLEDGPDMLLDIVRGVDDPRFRLCFDTGHANITKKGLTMTEWAEKILPYLGHAHLHNNIGWPDRHGALGDGEINMEALLELITEGQPAATLTIESIESAPSVAWLAAHGFLDKR